MKKLFIYASLLTAVFTACDPIEDRNDNMGGAITADQLIVSATPVLVDGVRSNKIVVENNSPCLSQWDYTVGTSAKAYDEVLLTELGDHVITFTGLNADGTKITKDLSVNVEAIIFQTPDMDQFFGNGTWVFDKYTNDVILGDVEGVFPYGTASYGDKVPTIKGLVYGEFNESDAEFSFAFNKGAVFTKTLADGTQQKGTFSYDLTKPVGEDWALGTVTLKGATIPYPYSMNNGGGVAYKFYILALEEDQMVLATVTGNKILDNPSGQEINVWMFRPEGWEPKGAEEQIALITGGDSKTWTWDEKAEAVFGNGPYLIGSGPEWWKVTLADMAGMASGEGKGATMTFSTDGTMVKTKTDGSTVSGTFMINMNKPTYKESGAIWAMGKLKTVGVGVLRPESPGGGPIDAYDILTLTEDKMSLSYIEKGAGAWGAAHFWMFQKK